MTIGKILKGNTVELLPLQKSHFAELEILASDKRIWEFYTLDGSQPPRFREAFDIALLEMERGTQFPFVIFHKESNKLIGSTRFLDY